MTSLNRCKDKCKVFIRFALPIIRPATNNLPTLPIFRAEPNTGKNSFRFIEEKQPNWWLLPKELRQNLRASDIGSTLAILFEATPPFSQCIGKRIEIPELGRGSVFHSGAEITNVFLVSYLFSSGARRWNQKSFNRIWNECLSYFDPKKKSVEYFVYAPIAYMPAVRRLLNLGDGLSIRRLPVHKMAELASLDSTLAGVSVMPRLTQWPVYFFVKRLTFKKYITETNSHNLEMKQAIFKWEPLLNEETVILRCFLNETLTVPTFAFIREGYPRDPGGGGPVELPWRVRFPRWLTPPSMKEVGKYKLRRRKFLDLHANAGWESVAASMRRFSIAWENQFRVDILADIVAALEHLVVRSNEEVSYKLRTRISQLLGKSPLESQKISKNLKDAYSYRSKTFHGGYVFDNAREFVTANRLKGAKGKHGNPFHDVNEVHRLIYTIAGYYRVILETMIDRGELEIDWEMKGL